MFTCYYEVKVRQAVDGAWQRLIVIPPGDSQAPASSPERSGGDLLLSIHKTESDSWLDKRPIEEFHHCPKCNTLMTWDKDKSRNHRVYYCHHCDKNFRDYH